MKKLLGLMIYGGILFGLSAGGAWYMKTQHEQALVEQRKELEGPNAGLVPSVTESITVTHPEPLDEADRSEMMNRVPVRAGHLSVEEVVQYGLGLEERDKAIQLREEALQRVEAQYRLVQEDIKADQMETEGILEQARNQKLAADEILKQAMEREQKIGALRKEIEKEREGIAVERTRAEKATTASASPTADEDASRQQNEKAIAAMLANMAEDTGARMLGDLMDSGDQEFAVRLLAGLEDRKAAKVLEALSILEGGEDKSTELLSLFQNLKRPGRSAKR